MYHYLYVFVHYIVGACVFINRILEHFLNSHLAEFPYRAIHLCFSFVSRFAFCNSLPLSSLFLSLNVYVFNSSIITHFSRYFAQRYFRFRDNRCFNDVTCNVHARRSDAGGVSTCCSQTSNAIDTLSRKEYGHLSRYRSIPPPSPTSPSPPHLVVAPESR